MSRILVENIGIEEIASDKMMPYDKCPTPGVVVIVFVLFVNLNWKLFKGFLPRRLSAGTPFSSQDLFFSRRPVSKRRTKRHGSKD